MRSNWREKYIKALRTRGQRGLSAKQMGVQGAPGLHEIIFRYYPGVQEEEQAGTFGPPKEVTITSRFGSSVPWSVMCCQTWGQPASQGLSPDTHGRWGPACHFGGPSLFPCRTWQGEVRDVSGTGAGSKPAAMFPAIEDKCEDI